MQIIDDEDARVPSEGLDSAKNGISCCELFLPDTCRGAHECVPELVASADAVALFLHQ